MIEERFQMQDSNQRPVCHRAEDLVTYLYGEAGEPEASDFRAHLQQCDACRSEVATFGQLHESILVWRNEALGTSFSPAAIVTEPAVHSTEFVRHERKLSALAALREFFNVSPLWLRGATAFAGLLLCALAIFAIYRSWERPAPVVNGSDVPRFTQTDLDRAVAQARIEAAQQKSAPVSQPPKETVVAAPSRRTGVPTVRTKPRIKDLTQEEREQLAADLRLIPGVDDEELPFVISDLPNE
jgi:anti-sigma factor RsiW